MLPRCFFHLLTGITWASLAAGALAASPSSPPPEAAEVILKDGMLFVQRAIPVLQPETRVRTVTRPDGTQANESYTVMRTYFERTWRPVPAGDYRVFKVTGEPLSAAETAARLADQTDVLLSTCGKKLDPAYKPLFDPQALIVYVRPQVECSPHAAMMPAPRAMLAPVPESSPSPVPSPAPVPQAAPAPSPVPVPTPAPAPGTVVPYGGIAPQPVAMPEFKNDKPAGLRPSPIWAIVAGGKLSVTSRTWRPVNETQLITKPVTKTVPSPADPNQTVEIKVQVCEPRVTTHWLPTIDQRDSAAATSTLVSLTGETVDVASLAVAGESPHLLLAIDEGTPLDEYDLRLFATNVRLLRAAVPASPFKFSGPAVAELLQGRAKIAGDTLTVTRFIVANHTKTVPQTIVQNGQEKVIHQEVRETVSKPVHQQFSLDKAQATTADGKPLDRAELARRLASEQTVILLPLDKKPDADEVKLLKGDTILLVLPGMDMPPIVAPRDAPVPSPPEAPGA